MGAGVSQKVIMRIALVLVKQLQERTYYHEPQLNSQSDPLE
jgi:hypothetical protein